MKTEDSTLYIVSTPIGNLEDITLRALNVLQNVDVIACEDIRHSLKLLNHYNIKKHLISYHSYNEENSSNGILNLLQQGKSVALITDGGTPCISDPGIKIVNLCLKNNIKVIPIPGVSSILTLLVVSGFRTDRFMFNGFLSIKEGKKRKELEDIKSIEATHIIFESPHRLLKTLDLIGEIFLDKKICIGKELTKINEKIYNGTYREIKENITKDKIAGEYIIIIANY
ncbi:MAG TPA: 16S rRNA (cytidine(1402)-2'-O)-methyltransferase [Spirochaetota bacterium]|nr:16S rRNA (cytidine(1402)-2'-O)-methyltransferase [Spirochaetota bacterium]HOL57197.1 16S rRNA (cytidine(1402)-2'-O)-methyltransferase [Spirochaetota bacterium]HPP04792.1 16S rRNA (cytidine(1402)-2'-O)-methyltransferase [Spirochaetota bacterium]